MKKEKDKLLIFIKSIGSEAIKKIIKKNNKTDIDQFAQVEGALTSNRTMTLKMPIKIYH